MFKIYYKFFPKIKKIFKDTAPINDGFKVKRRNFFESEKQSK
jgi:hypothetical protein